MDKKVGNYITIKECIKDGKTTRLITFNILELLIGLILSYFVISLTFFMFNINVNFGFELLISILLVMLHILYLIKKGDE